MSRSSSPDSSLSISSLLASCSLSRSGSSSRSSAAVTYKDRLYDSASKALEAYIRDYEEGLQSPLQTGKISLGGSARARPPAAKRGLVQDKIEVADAFPTYDPSPLRLHGSPRTDDILEVERSWENVAFPLKPPVPVLCEDDAPGPHSGQKPKLIEDFLNDCLRSDSKVSVSTFSGGHHHGPVEALKHMLFNLQTFQQSIGQGTSTEQAKEEKAISNPESLHLEQEAFPVNKSLQKAMHHLSRLKELVGDGGAHREENHQET